MAVESKVAAMARQEADEAEREQEGSSESEEAPNEAEKGAAEPGEAAKQQPSEKQIQKKIEAAWNETEKRVRSFAEFIGAPDDGYVICPNCDFPGHVYRDRGPLPPDREAAVLASIGHEDTRQYKPAPGAVACETCEGWGKLVRPTRVPDQQLAVCPTCNGGGWHGELQQPAPPQPPQYAYPPPASGNGPGEAWQPPPPPQFTPTA